MQIKLPTTILGRTGLEVTRLGFGCALWNPDKPHWTPQQAKTVWGTALDAGINHIETAHGYMKSENLFGIALKELGTSRKQFKMMTKGAPMTGDETRNLVEEQLKSLKMLFD